jgi:hypothetical protein
LAGCATDGVIGQPEPSYDNLDYIISMSLSGIVLRLIPSEWKKLPLPMLGELFPCGVFAAGKEGETADAPSGAGTQKTLERAITGYAYRLLFF